MTLYEYLEKNQIPTEEFLSDERAFVLENRHHLSDQPVFSRFLPIRDSFSVARAAIIIRAYMNKERLEDHWRSAVAGEKTPLEETLSALPSFFRAGERIVIPFFSPAINHLYLTEGEKLFRAPYKDALRRFASLTVDPFDQYGPAVFESDFSRLITVDRFNGRLASYDYAASALYLINEDGRLEVRFCLFDKGLTDPDREGLLPRLKNVARAYWNGDRATLLSVLFDNHFISEKAFLALREGK